MPDLTFRVAAARASSDTATPEIRLEIAANNVPAGEVIQSILLRCQVHLEPGDPAKDGPGNGRLEELFGHGSVWAGGPRRILWTRQVIVVPRFSDKATFDVDLPCSFDWACAVSKYLSAVDALEIPIRVFFSGTVFSEGPSGLEAHPIPWDREACWMMPRELWRRALDEIFPGTGILTLSHELIQRLHRHRRALGLISLERALEHLLEGVPSKAE